MTERAREKAIEKEQAKNLGLIDPTQSNSISNYNSPKAREFGEHNQITAIIYWNTINTQIRIKAFIKKTSFS